ncbi:DUF5687 family protein [Maribellus maritimus]|uniref:DUF5687 family protein n=1 Tax=Maribellus maritimus TaxID=2870838 RepID=UPI001EEC8D3B|nr:DUF5687 family protein [Maribellus maritimus]MCG6188649.1 DUF5687 family protein [Maribellus maritimus]
MKRNFFYFAWRELTRSAYLRKNMAAKGVLIFLALYFSLVALAMGFNLSEHLSANFPDQSQISAFNSLIFIYVGFELVIRIMVQNLPTFGFQPFLIIPVKRKRIARYMLNKSLLHFFNFLPLFLLLPFTFRSAVHELETPVLFAWLGSLFFMIFVNHFLAIYIKWRTNESDWFFYGFLIVAASIFAIDYFEVFDITANFGKLFDLIVRNPGYIVVFPLAIIALYTLNNRYLLNRFYIDEISQKKKETKAYDFSWLNQVGEYGKMLSLEVKMIARNKRPRTSAIMSILFIFYGLIIYQDADVREIPEAIMAFGGMFMTGIFSMTYGQFFPAWHSRYYPFLMAQNVKMKQVLQSAFFLMAVTNIVFYLLSLGYMYLSPKVLYIHFAVMLYNIGVNSFVIFALGLNSRKSINLDERGMFNYQGMGATQWLIAFPIIFGPMAVYGLLSWTIGNIGAYIVLGSLGLIGIILHPRLIDYFTKEYLKRKHRMIAAYKKS